MLLALTCALCTLHPQPGQQAAPSALELRLALDQPREVNAASPASPLTPANLAVQTTPRAELPLQPLPAGVPGSGDGDHSDHMTTMWIVMGGVMAVMMVGVGVYYMNHRSTAGQPVHATGLTGPAGLAIPVAAPGGG